MAKKKAAKKAAKKPAPKKRATGTKRPRNVRGVKKTPSKKTEEEKPADVVETAEAAPQTESETAAAPVPSSEPAAPLTEGQIAKELKHLNAIRDAQRKINEQWKKVESHKLAYKLQKECYDGLVVAMHELVNNGPDPQGRLQFEDDAAADPGAIAGCEDAESQAAVPDPEWMSREISVLCDSHPLFTLALVGKLAKKEIKTLGDLTRLWKSGRMVSDLPGFDADEALIVNDSYGQYGQEHPEVYGLPASPAAASTEATTDDPLATDEELAAESENSDEEFAGGDATPAESDLSDDDFSLDDLEN